MSKLTLIQFWDEFNTLLATFELYKSGNGAFDRSQFLTLNNGEEYFMNETKSYKIVIDEPRLTIFAAAHPHKIIKLLDDEKEMGQNCDGFISRFLFCAPKPLRRKLSNIKMLEFRISLTNINSIISSFNKAEQIDFQHDFNFIHLFAIIKLMHENAPKYTYSDEAYNELSEYIFKYELIAEKFELNENESFIRYVQIVKKI